MRHCDSYIRDKSQPMALRKFLLYKRIPAVWGIRWEERGWPVPTLFATWNRERVKVNMASRFGDVGITTNLNAENGYQKRVLLESLSNFSETRDE